MASYQDYGNMLNNYYAANPYTGAIPHFDPQAKPMASAAQGGAIDKYGYPTTGSDFLAWQRARETYAQTAPGAQDWQFRNNGRLDENGNVVTLPTSLLPSKAAAFTVPPSGSSIGAR